MASKALANDLVAALLMSCKPSIQGASPINYNAQLFVMSKLNQLSLAI
jgi:hypothetical protein